MINSVLNEQHPLEQLKLSRELKQFVHWHFNQLKLFSDEQS